MAERFSDMLLNRRRQMNLSIQQVANTIKIRPQIIEFFEMGDFSSMPPRGYAQGMISSYARFLGLNPRIVVDAYFSELDQYERSVGAPGGRFHEAAAEVSPHSSNARGRFYMVDGVGGSRYAQRPPQAGYVSDSASPHEHAAASSFRTVPGTRGRTLPPAGYEPDSSMTHRRPYNTGARGAANPRRSMPPRDGAGSRSGRPARGMDQRAPYGSRGGVLRAEGARGRGQVTPPRRTSGGRGGYSPRPQSSGFDLSALIADPRTIYSAFFAILVLLVIVILLAFRGCAPASTKSAGSTDTAASSQSASSKDSSADEDDEDEDADSSDTATDAAADTSAAVASVTDASQTGDTASIDGADQASEPEQTKVKVTLAKGKTSWIEIKVDGKIVVSESPAGPWEQEFTPTQSFQITVNSPGDVEVTKNGERVRYDSKSSGVGRITIAVSKTDTTATDGTPADGAATTTDGQNTSDQSSDSAQQTQ